MGASDHAHHGAPSRRLCAHGCRLPGENGGLCDRYWVRLSWLLSFWALLIVKEKALNAGLQCQHAQFAAVRSNI